MNAVFTSRVPEGGWFDPGKWRSSAGASQRESRGVPARCLLPRWAETIENERCGQWPSHADRYTAENRCWRVWRPGGRPLFRVPGYRLGVEAPQAVLSRL